MKALVKTLIPKKVEPLIDKIYWRFFKTPTQVDFSEEQYNKLAALKCAVSYNKYGGYCIPESSSHRPAAMKVINNDVFEPQTIEYMMQHCTGGDIIHAGTYFGDFLPALANACSAGTKIWAFEPNPENYRCAQITVAINHLDNVELTNAGLGAKQEKLFMKTADENGQALGGASQVVDQRMENQPGVETIEIVTIDESIAEDRQVSILQLDVEGYEKEALTGELKTIARCRPIIILEVLAESTLLESDWFAENILSLGYSKLRDIHGNTVFTCNTAA